MPELHPNDWKCPNCGKRHSRPHWKDYHQKQAGWRDYLGKINKASANDWKIVCEVCGEKVELKVIEKKDGKAKCPVCKKEYTDKRMKYCSIDGAKLDIPKGKSVLFCKTCDEPREGVEAPLFCPHCGWSEERVVITVT